MQIHKYNPFRILNLIRFLTNPIVFQENLLKKYSDPFPMTLPGQPTFWLTQDPEKVKTIFTARPEIFKTAPNNPVAPLLGKDGLIMQSGEKHTANRKAFMPFFSNKSLELFPEIIENIFSELTKNIDLTKKLHLQDFSQKITLKIIIQFLFPNAPKGQIERLENLVPIFCKGYLPFFMLIPKWVPFTWKPFLQKKALLDQLLFECYENEMAQTNPSLHNKLNNDDKNEILDQLRTLIVAGHETTAVSLTWSLYFCAKDSELTKTLSNKDTALISMKSFIKEVQRLCPPVPFIMRKLNAPLQVSDSKIFTKDEEIGVSISLLHKNPLYWEKPNTLIANRFDSPLKSSFSYAPYGGGNRKCLGASLADMELNLITSLFINKYQSHLNDQNIVKPEVLQITLGPKKPIYLYLAPLSIS